MSITYHLALEDEWTAAAGDETYAPAAFEREGFIHCTDGADELIATANRYYRNHPGPFVVLEIDLTRVDAPVRYEDDRRMYPHVYGQLSRAAVIAERRMVRDEDGTFVDLGDGSRP